MKAEVFDLVAEFYQQVKSGKACNKDEIKHAKMVVVDGDKRLAGIGSDPRFRARKMAQQITKYHDFLVDWSNGGDKYEIYTSNTVKRINKDSFDIVLDVINNDSESEAGAMAYAVGINYQNVKSLLPRVKRYISYASKMKDAGAGIAIRDIPTRYEDMAEKELVHEFSKTIRLTEWKSIVRSKSTLRSAHVAYLKLKNPDR